MDSVDLISKKIVLADQQINACLENEVVVLNLSTGKYYSFEGVASYIWKLCDNQSTGLNIVQSVLEQYEVDEAMCQEDVASFLGELRRAGLVEFV